MQNQKLPTEALEGLFSQIIGGAYNAHKKAEEDLLLSAGEATACIEDDEEGGLV